MSAAFHNADEPMSELNTTPLIDVMLVLLIMFIITIPVSNHKVPADLPSGPPGELPLVHRLDLDAAGRTFWDGQAVAPSELTARLTELANDPAEPVLEMNAHAETRYERFDETLAAVRRAGVDRLGFSNAQYARALEN